ncbi:biopolymer transporter Tol [Aquipuribacter sp. SD81]|uniref:biopolymer transporter Tol n=1 Tax=Aquipuribacter sp. SD81 TaxID=3127703 RepID=UPI00301A8FB9
MTAAAGGPLRTPDGRYLVVRGRLWRAADPRLPAGERDRLTRELMAARRDKGAAVRAGDDAAREAARRRVDAAKHALGERGPVWWDDGAPDLTRHLARTGPYAQWYAAQEDGPQA